MDALNDLLRALDRVAGLEQRRARLRKKKRPRASTGRPAKVGKGSGCGTGAGGFGIGNSCAKEDGIPQKPFGKGGGLKRVDPKEDLAKAKAMRPEYERLKKQRKLSKLRKEAAKRKAARDQAEQKAAADAAAKKKAALLQKVRVKKASEKLAVVGTPKSVQQELTELKNTEAGKKLVVASTPKSIKQELDELKAAKASQSLKVLSRKDVEDDLVALKQNVQTKKEIAKAAKPKQEKESSSPEVVVGETLLKKKGSFGYGKEQIDALDKDTAFLYGAHLKKTWDGTPGGDQLARREQKRVISLSAAERLEKMGIKESDVTDDVLSAISGDKNHWLDSHKHSNIPKHLVRRYALSAMMVRSWAGTSGDHSAPAVGIQYAIKEEFSIKGAYTKHLRPLDHLSQETKAAWNKQVAVVRDSKAVKAVLRAHYDATQERLRSLGVKELVVVRGYDSAAKIKPDDAQGVSLQPASSFTLDKSIAERFAHKSKKKRYMTARIPAAKVFSMCSTGFGCLHEKELTVLGGVVQAKVVGSPTQW